MPFRRALPAILLIAVPLLVYAQALSFPFLAFDDELLILDNAKVHGLRWTHLKEIFTTFDPELYVPLTLLTYQIEWSLFGESALAVHATNILLHIANGILAYLVLRRFLSDRLALLSALLFSAHPLTVEAVAWASARKDLLSSAFFLGSLLLYLRYRETGRGYAMSLLAFLLALLAKVSVFPLPVVLLLLDALRGDIIDRKRLREKIPYVLLSVLFVGIGLFGKPVQTASPFIPILLAPAAFFLTLFHVIVPLYLSIFYPVSDTVTPAHLWVYGGWILAAILAIVLFIVSRKNRNLGLQAAFFCAMIVPSFLNMVKGDRADGTFDVYLTSDRYAYVAMMGVLLMLASWKCKYIDKLMLSMITAFAILSFHQARAWSSSEALFTSVVEQGRASHIALSNLGGIRVRQNRLEDALSLFQKSLMVKPNARASFNMGQVYLLQKDFQRAKTSFEELLTMHPEHPFAHAKLGGIFLQEGDLAGAVRHLEAAQAIDPNIPSVHYNMGLVFEYLGERERARKEFERVLLLDPTDLQARAKLGK